MVDLDELWWHHFSINGSDACWDYINELRAHYRSSLLVSHVADILAVFTTLHKIQDIEGEFTLSSIRAFFVGQNMLIVMVLI